jgi:hypothetical protein
MFKQILIAIQGIHKVLDSFVIGGIPIPIILMIYQFAEGDKITFIFETDPHLVSQFMYRDKRVGHHRNTLIDLYFQRKRIEIARDRKIGSYRTRNGRFAVYLAVG